MTNWDDFAARFDAEVLRLQGWPGGWKEVPASMRPGKVKDLEEMVHCFHHIYDRGEDPERTAKVIWIMWVEKLAADGGGS